MVGVPVFHWGWWLLPSKRRARPAKRAMGEKGFDGWPCPCTVRGRGHDDGPNGRRRRSIANGKKEVYRYWQYVRTSTRYVPYRYTPFYR